MANTLFSQWSVLTPPPTADDLYSLCFSSENIGYAVGDNRCILKTLDGGLSWDIINSLSGINTELMSVQFVNDTIGFVCGINNFSKTLDGGESWLDLTPNNSFFTSVFFVNKDVGFLTTENNLIFKTSDGGINWNSQELVTGNSGLTDVYFINPDTGYCVGYQEVEWDSYDGKIFKTVDGGISWFESTTTQNRLNEIRFSNNDFGIAVGAYGYIAITSNGGVNWTEQNICDTCELESTLIINDSNILIAGYSPAWIQGGNPQHGVVYYSSDYSNNWNMVSIPTILPLQSITTDGVNNLFCVGYNGTILTYNNWFTNIIEIDDRRFDKFELSIFPNPTNSFLSITYNLNSTSDINISIIDCKGREIKQIFEGKEKQGKKTKSINLHNLIDGIYYCVVTVNEQTKIKKIIKNSL